MRRSSTIAFALLLSGCYSYQGVELSRQVSTGGKHVRIELTDAGTANVVPAIGQFVLSVEGLVAEAGAQGLTLSLESVTRRGEGSAKWNGEKLTLAVGDIRRLEERRTSRGRTAIAAAGFGGAGVVLLIAIAKSTGLVSGNPNRPPVPGT